MENITEKIVEDARKSIIATSLCHAADTLTTEDETMELDGDLGLAWDFDGNLLGMYPMLGVSEITDDLCCEFDEAVKNICAVCDVLQQSSLMTMDKVHFYNMIISLNLISIGTNALNANKFIDCVHRFEHSSLCIAKKYPQLKDDIRVVEKVFCTIMREYDFSNNDKCEKR